MRVTGLGPAGVFSKLLPAAFEQILEGRRPLGILPEIGEGLLLRRSSASTATTGRDVLPPVMMTVAPPDRRVGIVGRPRRRVAGGLPDENELDGKIGLEMECTKNSKAKVIFQYGQDCHGNQAHCITAESNQTRFPTRSEITQILRMHVF